MGSFPGQRLDIEPRTESANGGLHYTGSVPVEQDPLRDKTAAQLERF